MSDMRFYPGERVVIDLEAAQEHITCNSRIAGCGCAWKVEDTHRILRYLAEAEWRVAEEQGGYSICPYCHAMNGECDSIISLEVSVTIKVGDVPSHRWEVPRSIVRKVPAEVPNA